MARKLSENPPPADTFSEDEEGTESDEEEDIKDRHADAQNDDAVEQELTDDDDDAEGNQSPMLKKPDTSSQSDPELDSESTQPSPSLSAFTIKVHKSSPKPNQIGSKRSKDSESGLPAKKKGSAVQRLWSEDDELAILDGLAKFKSEKGIDPSADMVGFHEFIKESLHVNVSKSQLSDKIRRLKKKYRTNIERGENDRDHVLSKTHDLEAFKLSKKVWGGNERSTGNGSGVTLGLPSPGTGIKKISGSPNQEVKNVEKKSRVKVKEEAKTLVKIEENTGEEHPSKSDGKKEDEGGNVENFWDKYPFLSNSLDTIALSEGTKVILRENLGMIEKNKLKELEHKWESLMAAELELFVQKEKLVSEQVKLALDLMES